MKKSALILMFAFLMASMPTIAYAGPAPETKTIENNDAVAARASVLMNRLEEIKSMDKSSMTRSEKKELRKEVKAIKSELSSTGNGVYLSVGAIIIIILLLILLL